MGKETCKQQIRELRVKAESSLSKIDWATKPEDIMSLIKECQEYVRLMGLAKREYLMLEDD